MDDRTIKDDDWQYVDNGDGFQWIWFRDGRRERFIARGEPANDHPFDWRPVEQLPEAANRRVEKQC